MTVRVFIERRVPRDKQIEVLTLLTQIRTAASIQPGYISGETLRNIDDPEDLLVISTWHSVDDWHAWKASKEREELQANIDQLLRSKTMYRLFSYPDKKMIDWPEFWEITLKKTIGHGD
ncbi:MAG: antibiotic biosynthesis monooxygenase [Deltaproteobacteria bacterium]|nr:antibiotic biosynthesis monooxygenase [Deltaproteobacteria bacterium]